MLLIIRCFARSFFVLTLYVSAFLPFSANVPPYRVVSQFAEMLSGRYADVLSGLFLGYSTLWYTSHHKNVKGLDKVTDFAMQVNRDLQLVHAVLGVKDTNMGRGVPSTTDCVGPAVFLSWSNQRGCILSNVLAYPWDLIEVYSSS